MFNFDANHIQISGYKVNAKSVQILLRILSVYTIFIVLASAAKFVSPTINFGLTPCFAHIIYILKTNYN